MNITVLGAGYVGLVAAACLADVGHHVACIDTDPRRVARLRRGDPVIYEPGVADLMARNMAEGRLTFDTDLRPAVARSEAVLIAVGTPSSDDGGADLQYVFKAAEEIAMALEGYCVVINKSTVPVGTGDAVESLIRRLRPEAAFSVASNPEFLREGSAVMDFKQPDRVVIGVEDERAREVMRAIYRPVTLNEYPVQMTDRRTAELIKYAANAFLAMKVTFINEVADLCEAVGANVADISKGLGSDGRIGPKFLQPGPGYGGFCFPKDTLALARAATRAGKPMELVEATVRVNHKRKLAMADKIAAALEGKTAGARIAVLGLTFKAGTDDMREAPALVILPALQAMGAQVAAYDPKAEGAAVLLPGVELTDGVMEAATGADAVVILTEWDQFRALDLRKMRKVMRNPLMVDLRNLYDPADVRAAGFSYVGIGRKDAGPETTNLRLIS